MVKSEVRGIVTALSGLAAMLLLVVSVNPQELEVLTSIRFHLAVPMLVLPLALFALGARLRSMLMLAVVAASLVQGGTIVWQQQTRRVALAEQPAIGQLTLLSYNVLNGNSTATAAANAILTSPADVAVVMESRGITGHYDDLATVFPYRIGCRPDEDCDLSLWSRTPLIEPTLQTLGELGRTRLITARTIVNGQSVTVVAAHLSKPYFDGVTLSELWQILQTLRRLSGPLVLVGDFNAAAWSHDIDRLVRQADLVPPPRYPGTWPVEAGALGIPIDNMFTRGGALIDRIEATPAHGSNHLGLLAEISIRAPSAQDIGQGGAEDL